MSIHIPTDMDQSDPSTSSSGSARLSPTTTVFSSPPSTPASRIHNQDAGDLNAGDVTKPVPGWPKFARDVADEPAFAAFPSFRDLNVKSLLYYQAQLIKLRKNLHELEFDDHFHGDNTQYCFAQNLDTMLSFKSANPEQEDLEENESRQERSQQTTSKSKDSEKRGAEQLEILEKIRTILDKYNNALIQFSQISAFPEADSSNVECIRGRASRAYGDVAIRGPGSATWGMLSKADGRNGMPKSFWQLFWGVFVGLFITEEVTRAEVPSEFQEQLIVPLIESKPDGLTTWVRHSFIPLFHHVLGKYQSFDRTEFWKTVNHRFSKCHLPRWRQKSSEKAAAHKDSKHSTAGVGDLTKYSESWIIRVTSILTTIVACLLPVIAIVILSRVHSLGLILGLIALFNSVFAFGLVLLSSTSSRVEIFTATAAFSAVMVVFVQNKISQN